MADAGRASRAWTVGSLAGIAAWIAMTVVAAVTNDDPGDPTPILRTFALGGGAFFAVVFTGAAVGAGRQGSHFDERLYARLALVPVDPAAARRAARRSHTTALLYVGFGATSTALLLTAIALGESGPTRALLYGAGAVVVAWAVVGMAAMGRAYGAAGEVLAPLGLRTTGIPCKVPGGPLVGALRLAGERRGRTVEINQWPGRAVTRVEGRFPAATVADPVRLAAVTGEDAGAWRGVRAVAGEDGVVVERRGNGAGGHVLQDLLLAECLAGAGGDP